MEKLYKNIIINTFTKKDYDFVSKKYGNDFFVYFNKNNVSYNSPNFLEKNIATVKHHYKKNNISIINILKTPLKTKEILRLRKQNKIDKIFSISPNGKNISILVKSKRIWRLHDKYEINRAFIYENKTLPKNIESEDNINLFYKQVFKNKSLVLTPFSRLTNNHYFFRDNLISKTQNLDFQVEKFLFVNNRNDFNSLFDDLNKKFGYNKYSIKRKKINSSNFKNVEKKISELNSNSNVELSLKRNIPIPGNTKTKNMKYENNYIHVNYLLENETNIIEQKVFVADKNLSNSIEAIKIQNKIFTIATKEHSVRKINKKIMRKFLLSFISIIVFFVLLWFTFTHVFDYKTVNSSLALINESWQTPWPYILLMNWFITTTFNILLIVIFSLSMKKKISGKQLWNFFLASQIKFLTLSLTGNYFLAMFVWGIYISTFMDRPKRAVIGLVATITIIRGLLKLAFGSVFLILGSIVILNNFDSGSLNLHFNSDFLNNNYYLFIVIVAWIGLFFATASSVIIAGMILWKPIHDLFLYLYLKYKSLFRKNLYFHNQTIMENNLIEIRKSFFERFKNKEFMTRASVLIFVFIFLEAIETISIVNLITYSYGLDGRTFSVVKIAGLRSIVNNFSKALPFIPSGLVIIDSLLKNIYYSIFSLMSVNNSWPPPYDDVEGVTELSNQAAFLTRFFNLYLRLIVATIFSFFIFMKIFLYNLRDKIELKTR
ncbi:MAG: hypothetical protein GQ557_00610 [Mycoplasmataceae bacterium]|nr:hypothetical protein [Mycoplasmataceae bacterium]